MGTVGDKTMPVLSRRGFVGGTAAALSFLSSRARAAGGVRIGYQKYGNLLLLKAHRPSRTQA